jgi:RNA polymerase sigma factor (sigma-70 family)
MRADEFSGRAWSGAGVRERGPGGTEPPLTDDEAFAALYVEQRSALLWYLRSHGATEAEAADAVQDAFAAALRAADDMRDPLAWPSWLRTVALRCYLRSRPRARSQDRDEPGHDLVIPVADVPDLAEPADAAESRRQEELVLAMLAGLPSQQRRVFTLHYEGWSSTEIADQLGMDKAAVRQNIARARSALRELIDQEAWR